MIRRLALSLALLALSAAPLSAQGRPKPVRVALETSEGRIVVELATKQAPITTDNFLRYVDQKRFDGTNFYRAARTPRTKGLGFIQGGARKNDYRRILPAIAHEPTNKTGLHHLDGTISMARTAPGTAMGDFFITSGAAPGMDAHPGAKGDNAGYAAFGHVVSGMNVVKKILAGRTLPNAGEGAMRGQMLAQPIRIISARRVP